jgi:hypothetical protein
MGSDPKAKRKKTDAPIIRLPESFSSILGEAGKGIPELTSEKCPPSFQERLEPSPYLAKGIKVSLEKRGDRYLIMIQGTEVGMISKRNSEKISQCLELGVLYSGKLVFIRGEFYAQFFRETN